MLGGHLFLNGYFSRGSHQHQIVKGPMVKTTIAFIGLQMMTSYLNRIVKKLMLIHGYSCNITEKVAVNLGILL